jgi:colanic acid biosynthesis glycosyl transferase WcaI
MKLQAICCSNMDLNSSRFPGICMRILVHDYAGHPFQVQLSRELATRGHEVLHAYCGSTSTPRGSLIKRPGDSETFSVQPLDLGEMIPKTGYVRRLRLEKQYGVLLVDACNDFRPEVVISGNTPSIPQRRLARHCRDNRIRNVFWVQDIYGVAAYKLLKKKLPLVGHLVGKYFISLDRESARLSDELVVITEDFRPFFEQWGVPASRIHVVHNWAVLEELPQRPRENDWSKEHGLKSGPRLLYSGTLAMKHNPRLLLDLAALLDNVESGEMIVVSEGDSVEWLRRSAQDAGVKSIRFFPFQPFDQMANVLGSADALVAVLEPEAGVFSVPSKVLSYMCAGRALLAAMPLENLASRLIASIGAGTVVAPDDSAGLCNAAAKLLQSPETLSAQGAAARRYAESHFDIQQIADRFETILSGRRAG